MYNNPSPQYQTIFCTGYITLNVSGFLISHYSGFFNLSFWVFMCLYWIKHSVSSVWTYPRLKQEYVGEHYVA